MMSKADGLTPNWCREDEQNKCSISGNNRVYTRATKEGCYKIRSKPDGWKRTRAANESLNEMCRWVANEHKNTNDRPGDQVRVVGSGDRHAARPDCGHHRRQKSVFLRAVQT